MKNKSKLQKIQKGKAQAPKVPAEWLYVSSDKKELRQIYELFTEEMPWVAEYWEEAGVLEIAVPEAGSVDVEELVELDEYQQPLFRVRFGRFEVYRLDIIRTFGNDDHLCPVFTA